MPNPLPVQVTSVVLAGAGGAGLPVTLVAPSVAGNYKLIVFSNGYTAGLSTALPLATAWAQAGFVVAIPTHFDSRDRLPEPSLVEHGPELFLDYPVIERRVAELKQVMDGLPDLGAGLGQDVRIDAAGAVVAGGSMGAAAAMIATGALVSRTEGGPLFSLADPRFAGAILIANCGDTTPFFSAHSWDEWTAPRLYVSGTAEAYQRPGDSYFASPEGNKYFAWFTAGTHGSFTDALPTPVEREIFESVKSLTIGFATAVTGGHPDDFDAQMHAIERASNGRFEAYTRGDDGDSVLDPLGTVIGSEFSDVLFALPGGDRVAGRGGNDLIYGSNGDDVLIGGLGNDRIVGGARSDIAWISGMLDQSQVRFDGAAFIVSGPDGRDRLSEVEFIAFDDVAVRLDPSTGQAVALGQIGLGVDLGAIFIL